MADTPRTVSVSIDMPFEDVFDYVTNDLNWGDWAMGFVRKARISNGSVWLDPQAAAQGPVTRSGRGIALELQADWAEGTIGWSFYSQDQEGQLPSRLVRRPGGVDFVWTLPAGPDQAEASLNESEAVLADALDKLKSIMEKRR